MFNNTHHKPSTCHTEAKLKIRGEKFARTRNMISVSVMQDLLIRTTARVGDLDSLPSKRSGSYGSSGRRSHTPISSVPVALKNERCVTDLQPCSWVYRCHAHKYENTIRRIANPIQLLGTGADTQTRARARTRIVNMSHQICSHVYICQ